MNAAISAVNLTKFYGSQAAIEQVNFAVFPGDIVKIDGQVNLMP